MDPKNDPKIEPPMKRARGSVDSEGGGSEAGGEASTTPGARQPLIQYWAFRFTGSKIPTDLEIGHAMEADWIKQYGFQLEKGKGGVEHYQGAFEVEPKKRFCQLETYFQDKFPELIFDGKDYLQKCKSKAADRYAMKEDTRIRGPWWKGEKYDDIAKETVYRIEIKLTFWQQRIITHVLNAPDDDRLIWWFYEPYGGIGKTTFQKWIYQEYEGVIVLGGKAADMKNGVIEYEKKNGKLPKIILINFPKTFNMEYFSAPGMEEVKDMFFYSGKYEGGMVSGRPPKMIAMGNQGPPNVEELAADRWRIVRLPDGPARKAQVVELDWSEEGPMDEYVTLS